MITIRKTFVTLVAVALLFPAFGQKNADKAVFKNINKEDIYYYNTILPKVQSFNKHNESSKSKQVLTIDVEDKEFPNKIKLYKNQIWHQKPISQGSTGTCWAFSTTSLYESEVYRLSKKKVKLSEMYPVYWEYVSKANGFIESRGKSHFSEGSEANAVTRMYKQHGIVPFNDYSGLLKGQEFYDHKAMFNEMNSYLKSVKRDQAWNNHQVATTIKSILNKYMGVPPTEVMVDGKKMTPIEYMQNTLKIIPDDYVDILSYTQEPFYQQVKYSVPDNWWHSDVYYNIPLNEFMKSLDKVLERGYSVCIDADVSETGLLNHKGEPNVAIVPSFDIPSEFINDDARQFRFSNKTTTDDHLMHIVGSMKKGDHKWYLVKDSSSGARNNDKEADEFGYYFFRDDYVKLKVMSFTVHKDAVKKVLQKF